MEKKEEKEKNKEKKKKKTGKKACWVRARQQGVMARKKGNSTLKAFRSKF
jgi:hypothetical protein